MKRWILATLVLLVAIGALLFPKPTSPKPAWPLTISFTCDIQGRLVPCGCFSGQMGGLTRIATLLGNEAASNSLKVDVGDALGGSEDYQRIEYRYILQAFAKLNYDAVNLGHREAALPVEQLREIRKQTPVPLVAANLLDKSTGRPLFDTHRIVMRGPWRIALVGVMDAHLNAETLGSGLAIEPIESTLARLLPNLKKEADFIVLLAFADEAKLRKLAADFYELDAVLGGKVSQPAQQLIRENRSLILFTTNQSRALGVMKVTLEKASAMKAQKGEVILVHDKISENEAIRALAESYRTEIRRTSLAVDDPLALQADMVPGIRNAASFVGSDTCVPCHASAAKVWSGSRHSHAFRTLVAHKADADPNCIGCHSVGFGTPSGYRREFGTARLVNVGCESCHGPASQHVEQRLAGNSSGGKLRTIGAVKNAIMASSAARLFGTPFGLRSNMGCKLIAEW